MVRGRTEGERTNGEQTRQAREGKQQKTLGMKQRHSQNMTVRGYLLGAELHVYTHTVSAKKLNF